MRTLLLKSLFARPVTVPAPEPDAAVLPADDAILAELGKALEVRTRLQRLRVGNPCAQQRGL